MWPTQQSQLKTVELLIFVDIILIRNLLKVYISLQKNHYILTF